jgi:hypothetical protein
MCHRCKNKSRLSSQATGNGNVLKRRGGSIDGVSNNSIEQYAFTDYGPQDPEKTIRHALVDMTLPLNSFYFHFCVVSEGLAGFVTPSSKKNFSKIQDFGLLEEDALVAEVSNS